MNIKLIFLIALAAALSGCGTISNVSVSTADALRDRTIIQPNAYFLPSRESQQVEMTSHLYANVASCSLMQRYKLVTNADFTASLNLFKYRANMMGAERVVMVYHQELDATETNTIPLYRGADVVFREGTVFSDVRYVTMMVGDLYDCPCPTNVCNVR